MRYSENVFLLYHLIRKMFAAKYTHASTFLLLRSNFFYHFYYFIRQFTFKIFKN